MKLLLTILVQLIITSLLCGQGKEVNADRILLFELDQNLKAQFFEDSLANYHKPYFSHLTQVFPGYDVQVAFSKTESDSIFSISKNIIRVTSAWQKRFDPTLACCLGGDCKTWQLSSHIEMKEHATQKRKYLIEDRFDKNLVEKIIDLYEKNDFIIRKVHDKICIEDTASLRSSPAIIKYFENLKDKFGANNIYYDNQNYTCSQRCFLSECTKLIITRNLASDYNIDFINYSIKDGSLSKVISSDFILTEEIESKQ